MVQTWSMIAANDGLNTPDKKIKISAFIVGGFTNRRISKFSKSLQNNGRQNSEIYIYFIFRKIVQV